MAENCRTGRGIRAWRPGREPGHVHMRPGIVPHHAGRDPAGADMCDHAPGIQEGGPKTTRKENEKKTKKKKKQKKRTKKNKKKKKKRKNAKK